MLFPAVRDSPQLCRMHACILVFTLPENILGWSHLGETFLLDEPYVAGTRFF
jgi:hypothetical protein